MRGKGKSVRQPQSRTCSGRNTLKRCNNNGDGDNVVLIDVDSDTLDNVIIVDIPESLKRKLRGSSVICIDDDEDSDNNHPGVSVDSGSGALSDDGSFSGRFGPAFDHTRNSVDAVGDECQFVQENFPPLKLSKCRRTYSGKASSRNRYGLGPESSNSGSSDNDCPDCEFMEDSFGNLREQWEKANMKKKYDVRNGISGRRDQATSSGFHTGTQQNVDVGNLTDQRTQAQVSPDSSNVRCEEESPSPFVQTGDGYSGSTFNSSKKAPFADFGSKSTQETQFSSSKSTTNQDRGESFPVEPPFNNAEGQTNKQTEHGASSFLNEEDQCSQGLSFRSSHEQGNQRIDPSKKFSQDKERTSAAEPCHSNPQPTVDVNIDHTKSSLNSCFPNESEDAGSSSGEKEKLVSGQSSFRNIEPCGEMRVNLGAADNEVGAILKETVSEVPSLGKLGFEKEKGCCQDTVKQVPKEPSLCSIPQNEVHTEPFIGSSEQSGEMSNHQEEEEKDVPSHSLDGDVVDAVSSLINEREKLKETDEYKRAVEEEWASRQRELQLQAEEAQKMRRLRKRENAESMRLLDMEKRQKQRVEEVREIQKKDEENMNVKEQLRAEVRKELDKLENTCRDMASLLRGLGIQLGGGFKPLPHEVRAAYKRALLSFHPDRASGSDMRQLVEAEEKFKLISRMKDKFLKTS